MTYRTSLGDENINIHIAQKYNSFGDGEEDSEPISEGVVHAQSRARDGIQLHLHIVVRFERLHVGAIHAHGYGEEDDRVIGDHQFTNP